MQNKIISLIFIILTLTTLIFVTKNYNSTDLKGIQPKLEGKVWILESRIYDFPEGLYVPPQVRLEVMPGATLRFGENTMLSSHSFINLKGTVDQPIVLTSINSNGWRGVKLMGPDTHFQTAKNYQSNWPNFLSDDSFFEEFKFSKSNEYYSLDNVIIQNIRTPGPKESLRYNYMAALEILGTRAKVKNVTFKNIERIGAIRSFNSAVNIKENTIEASSYRKGIHINNSIALINRNKILKSEEAMVCRDGMWLLGSVVIAAENEIVGQGDDAFDLKNTIALIYNNKVERNKDEGIDADHSSSVIAIGNYISGSENGVQSSGFSEIAIKDNQIVKNKNGIFVRGSSKLIDLGNKTQENLTNFRQTEIETRAKEDENWQESFDSKEIQIDQFRLNQFKSDNIPDLKTIQLKIQQAE